MNKSKQLDDAVIVALGSNVKGRYASCSALLDAALGRFSAAGITVIRRSSLWRSAAWPDPALPEYVNAVALVETGLSPRAALAALLAIESAFGRRRGEPNAPRTLDLDLVAFGRLIIDEPSLTIPHPSAHRRRFVMGPLAEIAAAWVHPVSGETAADLAASADVGADAAVIEAFSIPQDALTRPSRR
ncbi:MAG: 2-amino-4-hydroxy-6-hydroxymethyldihydropteridine diphosphokinase [Caulobacteraceae bacterium]